MTKEFYAREVDPTVASPARIYDVFLDGTDNYQVDRDRAAIAVEIFPTVRDLARNNRGFLRRAVRYCAKRGIRQFIDIGAGIPTSPNVHEVAQAVDPNVRVVYADKDEEALITGRRKLNDDTSTVYIAGDACEPATILDHDDTRRLIDFDQPTAVLMVALLHFIGPDKAPHTLVRHYVDRLAPGSFLVVSHVSLDEVTGEAREQFSVAVEQSRDHLADPVHLRGRDEFTQFFTGLDIVPPGVTFTTDWADPQPVEGDDNFNGHWVDIQNPGRPCVYAAVGRKP